MQFALLGDVQFELITYFDGISAKFGADYAEHARIEGKPRLQFVGDKLDEWTLDLKFHQQYCDPEVELKKLRDAMMSHLALPFVLATGDYKGQFVITDISGDSEQTDTQGTLIALSASLTLREFVPHPDDLSNGSGAAVVRPGQALPPGAKNGTSDQAKPNVAAAKLKAAMVAGREVFSTVKAVNGIYSLAKSLQSNPLAAVEQLRNGVPGLNRIAAAADKMGLNMTPIQSDVNGGASVVAMAGSVAREARSASTVLSDVNAGNLSGRMDSLSSSLGKMGKEMDSAAPALAKLSAKATVREAV